ncbi:MAG: four helix bundle protein [Planctomycetes bacterium GWC2_45_44]|nr:MAG: four helix bundle protein [Planctomycetes bacterium GWC2_45_44]HBR18936.1 diversity-generating retroelement protein bAvd family protein [Phycisphaerales bacterium]
MKDFREIKVWQKSHSLALGVYKITSSFPREEIYGLTNQLRRAVVSISSNIAEGACRSGDKELKYFMTISMGSASEVEYQLLLSRDLGYIPASIHKELEDKVIEIKKMLTGYIKKLKAEG